MGRTYTYLAATSLAATIAILAAPAHAAGVSAGTLIENTAQASYTAGSSTVTVDSNTVTVMVDEVLDVAVTSASGSAVAVGSGTTPIRFTITNTGNGPEAFALTVDPAVAGNAFDATIGSIVIDSNGNHTYDPGTDAVLGAGANTPVLNADGSLDVFVLVSLPGGVTDSQTSQLQLTANAATGTGAPGTSFAGQGQGGGNAVVGSSGASDDALGQMVASFVTVTLGKSAIISDPWGGAQPVPGAIVTYSIVASVTGSGTATGLSVTDAIPTGTAYQPGTLKLDGSALTDASDSDAGSASSSGVIVKLGNVAAGSSQTVSFKVKID